MSASVTHQNLSRRAGGFLLPDRNCKMLNEKIPDYVRSREQFAALLGISVRTLARMEQKGETPPRVRISDNRVGYRQSAIDRFIAERTAA
jgi:predicted DNA-binding transcriptional regulator AlpA